jgi:hypothetical protein
VERFKEDVRRRVVPKPDEIAKMFMAAGENRPFLKVMFYTLARKRRSSDHEVEGC